VRFAVDYRVSPVHGLANVVLAVRQFHSLQHYPGPGVDRPAELPANHSRSPRVYRFGKHFLHGALQDADRDVRLAGDRDAAEYGPSGREVVSDADLLSVGAGGRRVDLSLAVDPGAERAAEQRPGGVWDQRPLVVYRPRMDQTRPDRHGHVVYRDERADLSGEFEGDSRNAVRGG